MPLLPGGESDLRQAIYDAVRESRLRIVDGAGEEVAVTGVGEINLSSTGLRLAKPAAVGKAGEETGGDETDGGGTSTEGTGGGTLPSLTDPSLTPTRSHQGGT